MIETAQTKYFWVSPKGKLLSASDGAANHIQYVVQSPDTFGFTDTAIRNVYARHGEPLGTEGSARSELLSFILKDGWVRVRSWQSGVGKRWYIEVHSIENQKQTIKRAIEALLDSLHPRDTIVLADKRQVLDPVSLERAMQLVEYRKQI